MIKYFMLQILDCITTDGKAMMRRAVRDTRIALPR
ncbi:hypothetical protein CBM2589_B190165 [Cupriavidus taiwanensis]|uniref:Uncharacterized protein n=1 Tax=Cupriavidus taiwanensis TaxID=164546 RepID=A0A375BLN3_9BURK|nr:hypothetical protein CBM2589_B190165 [Cupriavidus taiwanensis]